MKKILFTAAILALFTVNSNASEVAILDVEKIVKESDAMRDIQAKVSKKQEEYQKEVKKKEDELEKEQKRIEGKKSMLSEEALKKEEKEFLEKFDNLKTFVDRKQNSLKKASLEAMSKVNDEIKVIIETIAKEKSLDVIIPASQALYFKDSLDISAEVLEKLNKNLKKVKVTFEN
jgi:outer membrane protein